MVLPYLTVCRRQESGAAIPVKLRERHAAATKTWSQVSVSRKHKPTIEQQNHVNISS